MQGFPWHSAFYPSPITEGRESATFVLHELAHTLQTMYLQATWFSAPASLLCFLASCSRDTLLCTLVLCAPSTVTITLTPPAWPVSRLYLTLKGCKDERASVKTKAGGRAAWSYEPLLLMILYAFDFFYALFQQLCFYVFNYTRLIIHLKKKIVLRSITVGPETNLASQQPKLCAAKLHGKL